MCRITVNITTVRYKTSCELRQWVSEDVVAILKCLFSKKKYSSYLERNRGNVNLSAALICSTEVISKHRLKKFLYLVRSWMRKVNSWYLWNGITYLSKSITMDWAQCTLHWVEPDLVSKLTRAETAFTSCPSLGTVWHVVCGMNTPHQRYISHNLVKLEALR